MSTDTVMYSNFIGRSLRPRNKIQMEAVRCHFCDKMFDRTTEGHDITGGTYAHLWCASIASEKQDEK